MLVYLVVFVQRLCIDIFGDLKQEVETLIECLSPSASLLSYALLYFFVFEMMFITNTVKSNTHSEREINQRIIQRNRIIVFGFHFILYAPMTFAVFILYREEIQYYTQNIMMFRIILIFRAILKLVLDGYIITKFLQSYLYLIEKKKEVIDQKVANLQCLYMGSSPYTGKKDYRELKFALCWGCILVFFKVINMFSVSVFFGVYYSYPPD